MTYDVSRRSLLALGAGLGATTLLGDSALARAPKLGTQSPYWHRFNLGGAEVTVVSDGPLPLGPPKGTFIGIPDEDVRKMLSDNFLNPDNVVLEQNSPIVNTKLSQLSTLPLETSLSLGHQGRIRPPARGESTAIFSGPSDWAAPIRRSLASKIARRRIRKMTCGRK